MTSYDITHSRDPHNLTAQWILMQNTHGQWLYRNVQIHDMVLGTQAALRKEAIQKEIEEQMELGDAGLLEEDNWVLEVNLGNLENTQGNKNSTG